MDTKRILIIDDDPGTCQTLTHILKEKGYAPSSLSNGKKAIEAVADRFFNLTLLDLKLPDMPGIDVLAKIKEISPDTEVIIITGHASLDTAVQAMQDAAFNYVTKPIDIDYLLIVVAKALEKQQLQIDRKNAEEAMRESEERYRTLFEKTTNPIQIIDAKGDYIECNEAALQFLECTRDELLAKNIRDFIPPGKKNQVFEKHQPMWKSGGLVETEHYVNGKIKILELTITPTRWLGKRAAYGVGRDITERKKAEKEREKLISDLRAALAKIKTLSGIIPICAWCKKIRDDKGYWEQVEVYVRDHTEAEFSHGLCPECTAKMEKEIDEMEKQRRRT